MYIHIYIYISSLVKVFAGAFAGLPASLLPCDLDGIYTYMYMYMYIYI